MGPIDDWLSHTRHLQGYTPSDHLLQRMSAGEDVTQEEMEADENEFIRRRQLQEQEQQQQQQPGLQSDGEVEDDGDANPREGRTSATEVNYHRKIILVLAECQSQVLRPVKEETIREMIVSKYLGGDENAFCMRKFWQAIMNGVRSGRFFKMRNSYVLANKRNEAYDPKRHEKWLDDEEFDDSQREAMWIDYEVGFGLYDHGSGNV